MVACVGKELARGVHRIGERSYHFPRERGLTAHDFRKVLGGWQRGLFALRWAVFSLSGGWVLSSGFGL